MHGEPRLTRDIDLSVFTGFHDESDFVDSVLANYRSRIERAREHALNHRVLLIESSRGIPVDIGLAAFPLEEAIIRRAPLHAFGADTALPVVTAEDLIVLKAFAGRNRDWEDIRGVIARNHPTLNWGHIESTLEPLLELKESPESLDYLRDFRAEVLQAVQGQQSQ